MRWRAACVAAAVMVLAGGLWALWPHTSITRANAAQIKHGMTLGQVEALLGGPQRIDATGPYEGDSDDGTHGPYREQVATWRFHAALINLKKVRLLQPPIYDRTQIDCETRRWRSDEVAIVIAFDADERVIAFAVRPLRRAPESPLGRLRRWLGQ